MILTILMRNIFFALIVIVCSSKLYAFTPIQIKAVYLEKFTHLIEWPNNGNDKFVICVLNDEAFVRTLRTIYLSKTFNAKDVHIISLSDKDTIPFCDLLFIGKATNHVDKITAKLAKEPVLTVSDQQDFISKNIMITIFFDKERLSYTINNKAAQHANVKISYLLLNSAQEVIK